MAKKLQLRRGTTSQHSSFTGAVGEVTVDTDKDSLVVHDGSTAGGHAIAKSSDVTGKVTKAGGDTLTGTHTYDSNGILVVNGSFDYNGSGNATFTNLQCSTDIWCSGTTNEGGGISFYEASNQGGGSQHYITLRAPDGIASQFTLKLPDSDGSADEFLTTDGSGNLSWGTSSSGATGGGTDAIFVENSQTVTTSYSITSNKNAHSVGPISINNNIVVTIPANSTWLVS